MSEQLIQTPCSFGENDNFLLERELGAGGMGGVYMGRDKMLDRPVAVKVMQAELGSDAAFVERFKKEAQSVAKLIHPNIAQVYSYGICKGMPYIAMELASGGSLYSIMNVSRGKAEVTRVLKICQQVAQALQCSSDQGLVHGDIKPENILLDANGNAKLVDFGLAAMQKETDEIWGTPYYIAPEKVKKESVDFRADMYSLGGTLYHALTGVAPFEGSDATAVVKKRFECEPRKPSEIRNDLTPAIDKLILKMLAFDKEKRYPSFEALIEAFREVLTNGLVAKPAAGASGATGGAAKRPSATIHGGRRVMLKKRPSIVTSAPSAEASAPAEEEEEEGGSLGAKVVGMIFGVLALIGLVIGGLVWYQIADKKAQAAETQRQIDEGIRAARASIALSKENVEAFAQERAIAAETVVSICQKTTDRLNGELPEDLFARLNPGPTKELLDAIAATNAAAQAAANAANGATNPPPATATAPMPAVAQPARPTFRPPTEDEKDPASPEGQKYLEEKEKFLAAQTNQVTAVTAEVSAPVPPAATPAKPAETPEVVTDMNALWERAYACRAAAIRIRVACDKILSMCKSADEQKGDTKEVGLLLASLSQSVKSDFEALKGGPDVKTIATAASYVKSKGDKTVETTLKRLKRERLEKERADAAARAAADEAERQKRLAEEHAALIAEETEGAKSIFADIVAQGNLRQLEWKRALATLKAKRDTFKTSEGEIAIDLQIRKVNDMKLVHDIFLKNLKGYTFRRQKLKGFVVSSVDERDIIIQRPGNPSKKTIAWQSFYKDYRGNLNELFNFYIVGARKPDSPFRITNALEWCNAMTGAALTMTLVCSDTDGAAERAKQLVLAAIKDFPDYEKTARDIFTDMVIEAIGEEE